MLSIQYHFRENEIHLKSIFNDDQLIDKILTLPLPNPEIEYPKQFQLFLLDDNENQILFGIYFSSEEKLLIYALTTNQKLKFYKEFLEISYILPFPQFGIVLFTLFKNEDVLFDLRSQKKLYEFPFSTTWLKLSKDSFVAYKSLLNQILIYKITDCPSGCHITSNEREQEHECASEPVHIDKSPYKSSDTKMIQYSNISRNIQIILIETKTSNGIVKDLSNECVYNLSNGQFARYKSLLSNSVNQEENMNYSVLILPLDITTINELYNQLMTCQLLGQTKYFERLIIEFLK